MNRKILIVDDEETIRHLLAEFFEGFGFTVDLVDNGEKALEKLLKDPGCVVLLDLNLPGMNGLEVCKRIRQADYPAVVYAVTGYHQVFSEKDCLESGFDDFFTKPVDLHVLHNAVIRGFEKLEQDSAPVE